jgi:hypothetical protein
VGDVALIIIYSVVVFGMTGLLGFLHHRSIKWSAIDVIYDPLTALGIILLFANNTVQRELLERARVANEKQAKLEALTAARPAVRLTSGTGLVDSSLESLAVISEWRQLCDGGLGAEPRCLAAKGFLDDVDSLLKTARANYATPELRLSAVCVAGEQMLKHIQERGTVSSFIAEELIDQYKAASSRHISVFNLDATIEEANQFEKLALGRVNEIYRLAFKPDDSSAVLWLSVEKAQVDFSKSILIALHPCITAPRRELGDLINWSESKRALEQSLKDVEAERQRLKQTSDSDSPLRRFYLNLWPLVLITALSLKFGKGVSTFRRTFME